MEASRLLSLLTSSELAPSASRHQEAVLEPYCTSLEPQCGRERDSRQLPGSLRDVSHLQSLSLPDVFSAILSTASIVDRKSAALCVSNYAKNFKIISKSFHGNTH